jgi:hypothetical protein
MQNLTNFDGIPQLSDKLVELLSVESQGLERHGEAARISAADEKECDKEIWGDGNYMGIATVIREQREKLHPGGNSEFGYSPLSTRELCPPPLLEISPLLEIEPSFHDSNPCTILVADIAGLQ